MRCPQCRHENPGDGKFCLECGRWLALMCWACATELPAGAKFCKECGAPVGTSTSSQAPTPAPDSYTPKHLAERIIIQQVFPYTAARLGLTRVLLGNSNGGLPLLEEAVRLAAQDDTAESAPAMTMLGEAYLALGRPEDAHEQATRARDMALRRGERGHEAWTLWLLGEIDPRRDPGSTNRSSSYYRQALSIGTELGMRPLVTHCHLGLGKLYLRSGNREQAQEHLATATTMYRDMDMRFWLEQAEAEMRKLA